MNMFFKKNRNVVIYSAMGVAGSNSNYIKTWKFYHLQWDARSKNELGQYVAYFSHKREFQVEHIHTFDRGENARQIWEFNRYIVRYLWIGQEEYWFPRKDEDWSQKGRLWIDISDRPYFSTIFSIVSPCATSGPNKIQNKWGEYKLQVFNLFLPICFLQFKQTSTVAFMKHLSPGTFWFGFPIVQATLTQGKMTRFTRVGDNIFNRCKAAATCRFHYVIVDKQSMLVKLWFHIFLLLGHSSFECKK